MSIVKEGVNPAERKGEGEGQWWAICKVTAASTSVSGIHPIYDSPDELMPCATREPRE